MAGPPLVGRGPQLATLLARLAVAGRGAGGAALVAGEPGIGKTRLLAELADRARAEGWTVLTGRAFEGEGVPPYLPIVEALRPYIRAGSPETLRARLGRGAPEVALLVPELRDCLPGLPAAPPVSPEYERYRLFESVADFLLAIARAATGNRQSAMGGDDSPDCPLPIAYSPGLLLALDDLHWADRSTLRLLQHLMRRIADAPLLLVGAYRTTEIAREQPLKDILADLHREHRSEPLTLTPLAADEVAVLIAGITGVPPAPPVAEAIHRHAEGNPFFVEEVIRHLQGQGYDLRESRLSPAAWSVPEGVRHVIGQRLSRLSRDANRMLQAGAVLGDGFRAEVVAATSGLAPVPLMDSLDEALGAGFLREAGDSYHFTHALIRHTLDGTLNAARRQWLHLRAAVALEGGADGEVDGRLGQIAMHYRGAGPAADPDTVRHYAMRAGEQAAAVFAWEEAASHWQAAYALLDPADEARRCEHLLLLGEVQRRAGEVDAARRSFHEAIDLARRLHAPQQLACAALGIEPWGRGRADPAAVALLDEALDAIGEDDSAPRAMLLARLATELRFEDVWDRCAAMGRQAVAVARRVGDPTTLALTLYYVHWALWRPDNVDERLALATEIVHLGEETGDISLSVRGHHARIWDLLQEDVAAADRDVEAFARLAAALRQPDYLWMVEVLAAMRALLAGRLAEAEHLAQQALAVGERGQPAHAANYYVLQMLGLRGEQGRLAEMEETVTAFAERSGLPTWHARLAEFFAGLGRTPEARREFERLARHRFVGLPRDYHWLAGMTALARACALLGDADRAAILYDLLLPHAERTVMLAASAVCRGVVAHYLGLLATAMGRWDRAAQHFEEARVRHERLGARPLLAHTLREHASMLLLRRGRGDLAQAAALLDQALAIYGELGMEHHAATVRGLLAGHRLAAGARLQRPYPDGLSEREVHVLRLLAAGKSNRAIADALVVSPNTVAFHVKGIFNKTGAANRTEAAAYAHQHGLTGPSA
jgi:DNA-binding CsgD family transcriptional regulator